MTLVRRFLLAILLPAFSLAAFAHVPSITNVTWTNQTINWTANPATVSYTLTVTGQWIAQANTFTVTDIATGSTIPLTSETVNGYVGSNPASSIVATATFPVPVSANVDLYITQAGGNTGTNPYVTSIPDVVKPTLKGLIAQGDILINNDNTFDYSMVQLSDDTKSYAAAVVSVGWDALQPTNNGTITTSSNIDTALNNIGTYISAAGHPLYGKLRVYAGLHAPSWAMSLDGGPAYLPDQAGNNENFPIFWGADYHNAWAALVTLLGKKYDRDPRIAEVAITSCSSTDDEPFLHNHSSATQNPNFTPVFSDSVFEPCLENAWKDYYDGTTNTAWQITPLDYTFNGYNFYNGGNDDAVDNSKLNGNSPVQLPTMKAFRAAMGTRGTVANHGLQYPMNNVSTFYGTTTLTLANGYGMEGLAGSGNGVGGPMAFQSYAPNPGSGTDGGWGQAVTYGLCTFPMTELELFPGPRAPVPGAANEAEYTTVEMDDWYGFLTGAAGHWSPTCN